MRRSKPPTSPKLVAPALAIAALAISFAAIFFRLAAPTHPLAAACLRLAMATVLLAPFTVRAARLGRLGRRVMLGGAAAGLLYGLHFASWVASLYLTTVAASVTLVTATPLLLALVALFTGRDRPTSRLWLALALATIGVTIIGGTDLGSSRGALAGDALAILGCAAMAGYLLIVRRLPPDLDVLGFSGLATAGGAASLAVACAASGVPIEPASTEALLYLLLAALIPQLIGHTTLTWSLRHATPTQVGLATVGEPVGATFLAWIWLDEVLEPATALGCAITLVAVLLGVTRRRQAYLK